MKHQSMRGLQRGALGLAGLLACLPAGAAEYRIVSPESRLHIHVGKAGLFGFAGHAHEVYAGEIEGRIRLEAGAWSSGSVELSLPASALRVDPETEPPKDLAEVQATMESRVLEIAAFPQIAFRSTAVSLESHSPKGARIALEGELSFHGVTRPIELPVEVTIEGQRLTAKGRIKARQKDYAIKPVSAAGGTVKVKDELEIDFEIVALEAHKTLGARRLQPRGTARPCAASLPLQ